MENLMKRAIRNLIPALLLWPLLPWGMGTVSALQEVPGVAIPAEARTIALDQLVPVSPDVRVGRFENGLTYYIRENREPANRTDLRLVVDVGSILEDDDQLGLAHFLEHMAFNGTENFEKDELVRFMESIGMRFGPELNASTSYDETNYYLTVPMDNPEYLETAFRMLRDWASGLTLDPEEIDQERGVVIEEWRFRRGAAARVRDLQFPLLFRDSRYVDRNPIGTVESLQTFEHEVLRRFYEDWYRPDLMAVIVVGDFDADDVEALMREHIETLPSPAQDARERVLFEVPSHSETLYSIVTDPEITRSEIAVYHKMERVLDWTVGGYRQQIVESLYNAILNERLSEMARRPDAPFLAASSGQGKLIRTKDVYALSAAVADGGVERGLEALFLEAERVERFGFTESELERARINTLRMFEQAYINRATTTSAAFAAEYSRAFLEGESIPGIEYEWELYQRFIPEITLEEINRVGREWIRDTDRVVLLTAPERELASLPDSTRLAAVLAGVRTAEVEPYEDEALGESLIAEIPIGAPVVESRFLPGDITEWRLANGVRVVLKPTSFREDQVLVRGFSPGGISRASDEDLIPARTAIQLVEGSGVGEYNAIALGRLLTGTVANASALLSEFEEGIAGSSSKRDLETLFQLIYLRFTAPRADEDFLQVWMAQAQTALTNRDADPEVSFSDTYSRLVTQDHPRERPITLASLVDVDLDASLQFYRDRFADAGDFTFVFVGSLELDVLRPLVEQYLGGLPATGRNENWVDHGVRTPRGVVEETVRKGLDPISQTVITFSGPFNYSDQMERVGYRAFTLALDTRLNTRVREELGATYGVNVSPGSLWRPEGEYRLSIFFGSDPERVDEVIETIFEVISDFRTNGPTEAELADAREAILRQFETDFRENATWLSQLVVDYQRGVEQPGSAVETFDGAVRGLTVSYLRTMAERMLDPANYVRVTLLPE